MAGELAAEWGVEFAELHLGEGVADFPNEGVSAKGLDSFGGAARGADVVENRGAGELAEVALGHRRDKQVGADKLAMFVNKHDAVGVAIEDEAEICAGGADGGGKRGASGRLKRVRRMAGEGAVNGVGDEGRAGVVEEGVGGERAHAVGAVDDHLQAIDAIGVGSQE